MDTLFNDDDLAMMLRMFKEEIHEREQGETKKEEAKENVDDTQRVWHPTRGEYVSVNSVTGDMKIEEPTRKRKLVRLEEGEILEPGCRAVCSGFFFDTTVMRRVSGCSDCVHGSCKRKK